MEQNTAAVRIKIILLVLVPVYVECARTACQVGGTRTAVRQVTSKTVWCEYRTVLIIVSLCYYRNITRTHKRSHYFNNSRENMSSKPGSLYHALYNTQDQSWLWSLVQNQNEKSSLSCGSRQHNRQSSSMAAIEQGVNMYQYVQDYYTAV